MQTLNTLEMTQVVGGTYTQIADGACAVVGVAAFFTPISAPVGVGCAAWAVYRAFF